MVFAHMQAYISTLPTQINRVEFLLLLILHLCPVTHTRSALVGDYNCVSVSDLQVISSITSHDRCMSHDQVMALQILAVCHWISIAICNGVQLWCISSKGHSVCS